VLQCKRTIAVSRAAFVFAVLLLSSGFSQSPDFDFIQMSDPQFGMYTNNQDFKQETANFEFAIATANRLRPSFVIVCGDLVNKAGDETQIAEYLRIVHRLDPAIPVYNVAGNHDVGNIPTHESLKAYRKVFGPDHYIFRYGNLEGIVLNSSIIQHPDKVEDEAATQENWLKKELQRASSDKVKWIVIFQHIPWFLKNADEPDQYFNIPRETRTRYLSLFERSGVKYLFAGHLHQNSLGEAGSLHAITTGPVGKPLGKASSGIRLVRVSPDALNDKYFGLGNLPDQIDGPDISAGSR
jgi:3',5'-cyclic AMP phosphodiesterase CpdA